MNEKGKKMKSQKQREIKTCNTQSKSRRSLFKKGAAAIAAAAGICFAPKSAREAFAGRVVRLQVQNAVFTSQTGPTVNYFIVVGDITMFDGKPVTGKYFCKGVIFPFSNLEPQTPNPGAATFVDQLFRIDGEGSIMGVGTEIDATVPSKDNLAIVGGNGKWVGAHGSYTALAPGPIPFGDGNIEFMFNIRRG